MAVRQQPPPRLHIPPHLAGQQPAMFSPALPSAIQTGYPQFSLNTPMALQTPMQASFFPQPPPAPGRPNMHRSRSSMAPVGMMGPPGMPPITPLGQGFPVIGPAAMFPQPGGFAPRSRRTMSMGGPPKAPLGGPGKQHNPVTPAIVAQQAVTTAPKAKGKKMNVNLPKEVIPGEDGQPSTRPPWAREPLRTPPVDMEVPGPDLTTAEELWEDPDVTELFVYLPSKRAWDSVRNREIEEKLDKMGIERGSGSNSASHVFPPHARAASVSSPADPALLLFRLNKLQQSQSNSPITSLTASPQPPLSLAISPNGTQKPVHGHSMSLVNPPSRSPMLNAEGAVNPFGPQATLGSEPIDTPSVIHAPQGRVPVALASLAPPTTSRPTSRPDFIRGFGLDIPEEDEEAEAAAEAEGIHNAADDAESDVEVDDAATEMDEPEPEEFRDDQEPEGTTTASQSRHHSRHVSKLSAALSLHAVGGLQEGGFLGSPSMGVGVVPVEVEETGDDVMGEWTGSEDLRLGAESSDDESIGEWSNPSDEERARQQRLHRRMLHRSRQDNPRRLPEFPRPPAIAHTFGMPLRSASVDDDVVSNPSDDERIQRAAAYLNAADHFPRSVSSSGRPLPPLPHSRATSGQYSIHDPAYAHSRGPSINTAASPAATAMLNPLAKPFVFGPVHNPGSFSPGTFGETPAPPPVTVPSQEAPTHVRQPSLPKSLNATAPAFTPGAFSFRPPVGVPQMNFTSPASARPLPTPPQAIEPARPTQGREKRQRISAEAPASEASDDDEPLINLMTSFKFPSPEKSKSEPMPMVRRPDSAPTSPSHAHPKDAGLSSSLNAHAKPFTFSSGTAPSWPSTQPDEGIDVDDQSPEMDINQEEETSDIEQLPMPPQFKPKRAPIPLDFKHHASNATVPAGLFKALSNNSTEERRRGQHSRFASRTEVFDTHTSRGSLDDLNVVPISLSRKVSRNFVPEEQGQERELAPSALGLPQLSPAVASAFRHTRRASFPGHSAQGSSVSEMSIPSMHVPNRSQGEELRADHLRTRVAPIIAAPSSTDIVVAEIHEMLRAQSRQLHSVADDQRGALDMSLIKDIVERGNARSMSALQHILTDIVTRMETQYRETGIANAATLGSLSQVTIAAVSESVASVAARIAAQEAARPQLAPDHGAIAAEVIEHLLPHLSGLRAEPIDYDGLTSQLSQAVKPHITQLIDLASDKRETASLIVDSLRPTLASLASNAPTFDINALASELTAEVRRVVAPIDAHEIKEQVSDLVVERLDSRLAVRERAFNLDGVAVKVVEGMAGTLEPLKMVTEAVEKMTISHQTLNTDTQDLLSSHKILTALISDLPTQLIEATEALRTTEAEIKEGRNRSEQMDAILKTISDISSALDGVHTGQKALKEQVVELSSLQEDVVSGLNALPEVLVATTKVLDDAHNDMMSRDSSYKRDFDEVRSILSTNTDLQVQLAKARGAHGQVRVEKDMLGERLHIVEEERDALRKQVEELQAAAAAHTNQVASAEIRNAELQQALGSAQEHLKSSEITVSDHKIRQELLESENKALLAEQAKLKEQLASFELRVTVATKEKETAEQVAFLLRAENERITADQQRWDELRRATEQIEALSAHIRQADQEELQQLRAARDHTQALEVEHTTLQKRFKEQEARVANTERTAFTARQTLSQAQQRAAEWEKRAKENDAERIAAKEKLEETELARAQLETDLANALTRLEEKEADARLTKDREERLKDQANSLEGQVAQLRVTVQQLESGMTVPSKPVSRSIPTSQTPSLTNGYAMSINRPSSPASTIGAGSRSSTPTGGTPPQTSIRDSMHAPSAKHYPLSLGVQTPDSIRRPANSRGSTHIAASRRAASPAPSTVSNAPTLGDDGWWE